LKPPSESLVVNSFHNDRLDRALSCFQVIAQGTDSVIEAIEHKEEKIVGIMWHPERISKQKAAVEYNRLLLRNFLDNK